MTMHDTHSTPSPPCLWKYSIPSPKNRIYIFLAFIKIQINLVLSFQKLVTAMLHYCIPIVTYKPQLQFWLPRKSNVMIRISNQDQDCNNNDYYFVTRQTCQDCAYLQSTKSIFYTEHKQLWVVVSPKLMVNEIR